MVRRVGVIVALAVSAAVLSGCSAPPARVLILDRPQSAEDALPAGTVVELDTASSRYVGADSDGDRYWVATPADDASSAMCVVYEPRSDAAGGGVFCGALPLSSTTASGKTIEFRVAPVTLDASRAEVVGDTLLVADATPIVSG